MGYCLFLFVLLTLLAAVALAYLDPPHPQPTLPAEIAAGTLHRRARRKGLATGAHRVQEIAAGTLQRRARRKGIGHV